MTAAGVAAMVAAVAAQGQASRGLLPQSQRAASMASLAASSSSQGATFGGVEALLIGWLPGHVTARFLTDLPADLAAQVPVVQVVRIGGPSDDNLSDLQFASVAVDCFAADRASATVLAQQVDDALRKALPGTTASGGTVTKVRTLTGASWRPYDDVNVRRFGGTYQVVVRTA